MNLNAKVALSLILGTSILLSACDNKENTSTQVEKAVRIPTSTEKAESTVEKSKELVAETQAAEKAEKTESADVKADAKNLSGDSFCRQEERRLFLEIQRIKDELRGIEE